MTILFFFSQRFMYYSYEVIWFQVIYIEVSEQRLLFIANSAIFKLYHGENKLISNEMMMRSALF